MKLCAMVFEFHHTPTAITGATGHASSTAPCAIASAINMALVAEVRQPADRRILGVAIHLAHAEARRVRVWRFGLGCQRTHAPRARRRRVPRSECHDLRGSCDLLQIVPLAARDGVL